MFGEATIPPLMATADSQYAEYVNPEWVNLLSLLGLNRPFVKAQGAELCGEHGEVYLDFLSGYGVYNVGHHHPYITRQLIDELQSQRPSMLQSHVPTLAGLLAERLCKLAGGRVSKVYFGSTGSEAVESAIKFSRSFTKRDWILYAEGGFHGLTCGALSLMSNPWWREGFGNLLRETAAVPFGDIDALRREIETERYAAYIVEPIQGETGVVVPPTEYLREAQRLCDLHGTLLVIDEVQTGVYRTGPFIASHLYGITPDIVLLAKALSGGHVPVSAMLMRSDINHAVYSSVDKAFVHASTFSENSLAMRAGLATLDVIAQENLSAQCIERGKLLRGELRKRLARFDMVAEIRGEGLLNAIEFRSPKNLGLKMLYSAFAKAHPGLFGQMIVRTLFHDQRVLSQMAGNNFRAIKVMPPLVISEAQILTYVDAMENVCESIVNNKAKFWTQGLSIGAKAFSLRR